ncbi:MAG: leucyl aminopeptidase family protein [Rhodobacteraceae bacterium]|nr:leucyl aminopeptidase family protein [Paracoccaceae bacterium]
MPPDFATPPVFADPDAPALPLHLLAPEGLDAWCAARPDAEARWVRAAGFTAAAGSLCLLPGEGGGLAGAAFGLGDAGARARARFAVGAAASALPAGTAWRLEDAAGLADPAEAALGWLLESYRFRRYRADEARAPARLVAPAGADGAALERIAAGEVLTRELINTPAADMGPATLEAAVRALAAGFGAEVAVTAGEALLAANLPLVHAVGRAAAPDRAPRLIELRHGSEGPRLTLVGKGVCFDTGGLNLKPAASMALMKKDMGGAATVLGLARMILSEGWKVRLRVLIPAVENAVAGAAFRPGDILTARNGLTVEINNTDAEGRLVLADALALAAEEGPDVLVSMATLTGAARVALGPDLAPFYCDDEGLAAGLAAAGAAVADPLWRMPFWAPYEAMIEPGIADLDNAPSGGMAGSITAALFLRRFAGAGRFVHFDIYGWQPGAAPGRPRGGVGQGARALLAALPGALGL